MYSAADPLRTVFPLQHVGREKTACELLACLHPAFLAPTSCCNTDHQL